MAKLIAEKSHDYGTRRLKAGDEYEASESYAKVLVAVHMARYAKKKAKAAVRPADEIKRK